MLIIHYEWWIILWKRLEKTSRKEVREMRTEYRNVDFVWKICKSGSLSVAVSKTWGYGSLSCLQEWSPLISPSYPFPPSYVSQTSIKRVCFLGTQIYRSASILMTLFCMIFQTFSFAKQWSHCNLYWHPCNSSNPFKCSQQRNDAEKAPSHSILPPPPVPLQ